MRIGVADFGMNVWYGGCFDPEQRLRELKTLGFDGIERVEAVDAADALNQAMLYRKCGMDFATCRGPKVRYNVEWTCALGKEYIWLELRSDRTTDFAVYCRQARELARVCRAYGLKCALHNHMGTRVETPEELDEFLAACPEMALLLDIGHLRAAGGDACSAIEKYHDKLVAVHFKDVFFTGSDDPDWRKRLRFCELGGGNAGMDFPAIGRALKRSGFAGWTFIEQDTHRQDPAAELRVSLDVMRTILN